MRERHFPRVCRSCRAPMARQEHTCWRCGARWVSEEAPTLRVIAGGTPMHADRWVSDGGSVADQPAAVALGAAVGRG
jgi:predicted amidophosphoribosyltransferase